MKSPEFSPAPLRREVSNDLSFIADAIKLHDMVFGETDPSLYNNKDEWLKRINTGGYFVVSKEGEVIDGFAVCDLTSEGDFKIWLAGVDPKAQNKGVWSGLFGDIVDHAQKKGYEYILINTFPKKFPAMYSFLQKMNAEIYNAEQIDGVKKIYARIKI